MGKIREINSDIPGTSITVQIFIYYLTKEKKFFCTILPDIYNVDGNDMLENHRIGSKFLMGCTGATEESAIKNIKEYLAWYGKNGVKLEKVILIEVEDSRRTSYGDTEKQKETEAEVSFKFYVGNKQTAEGKVSYKKDKDYYAPSYNNFNDSIYGNEDKLTEIPYNEENLKACEDIVEGYHQLNDKVKSLFKTTKKALETLSHKHLLSYDLEPVAKKENP